MYKPDNTPQLEKMLIRVHPRHKEMMQHFMESKGVGSYSEVIRQAIVFLHDKTFPDYVYRETPASQLKRSKAEQAEAWERMTDEEYVKDILQAPMFSNENGNSYAIVHTLGNSVMALKV